MSTFETEDLVESLEMNESAILAAAASGIIVDVVKRIFDKFGEGKKKSKWYDFRKHIIEKTPEGQINIWNLDGEQIASDLKTVKGAKEKIKDLVLKAKAEKKAAKKTKSVEPEEKPVEQDTKSEETPGSTEDSTEETPADSSEGSGEDEKADK
jgi:hypothetical protein